VSKHTHCRWQLDKGSWISNDVKDENRCVWVLESDYLNMKESLEAENARLKAEVERLRDGVETMTYHASGVETTAWVRAVEYDRLKAEVGRLTKENETINKDRALLWASHKIALQDIQGLHYALQTAKEGKQS
jgi:predicted nuclease with TOPRIM domain